MEILIDSIPSDVFNTILFLCKSKPFRNILRKPKSPQIVIDGSPFDIFDAAFVFGKSKPFRPHLGENPNS